MSFGRSASPFQMAEWETSTRVDATRGLAPHPCFEIRIETTGGMSGGPVFTQAGLSGVLSAGANDAPYSLASFIATCYQLGIDCDFGDGLRRMPSTTS